MVLTSGTVLILLAPHARLAWVYIGAGSSKVDAKRDAYMPTKTAAVLAAQKDANQNHRAL